MSYIQGVAGQRRFAQAVVAEVVRRDRTLQPRFNRADFSVEWGNPPARLFLENTYWEWLDAPEREKALAIEALVDLAFRREITLSWDQAAPRLLPAVRNRRLLLADPTTSGAVDPMAGAAFIDVVGDLAAVPAVAERASVTLLNHRALRNWGVDPRDAMARAIDNLRAVSPSRFERDADGFYVSRYDDQFDAARILLPEIFQNLPLSGPPIAIVVSRRCVVCAGAADDQGLFRMAGYVERLMQREARPISCRPILLNSGKWWPLNPEAPQIGIFNRLLSIQADIDRMIDSY
ncbi:MAG TPA: hypothetical protein VFN88_12760 [Caulobacteraceae bacterium]|nr:hypothetical protein [Caulobacteraceae bacterium]